MRKISRIFLLCSFVYAFGIFLFISSNHSQKAKAATNHIVISQIQISGSSSNDEFVELYNPTNSSIDLSKWRLTRKSSTGGSVQNLVASISGTIAPRGYFLIAHPSAITSSTADQVYSSSSSAITTNNTITLFSDAGITTVDKVGIGTAVDAETAAFSTNPDISQSIMRKATQNSTETSLINGGAEATLGNGFDTDNNANDFVLIMVAQPRNSKSPQAQQPTNTPLPSVTPILTQTLPTVAPTVEPTPTSLPTVVPTNTPEPTATIIPTVTPTVTPKPTNIPTPTSTPTPLPTSTPTPTKVPAPTTTPVPTVIPTSTPTPVIPTPTVIVTIIPTTIPTLFPTVTPMPEPSMTPTPTPSSKVIVNQTLTQNRRLVCTQTYQIFSIFGYKFSIPKIQCSIIRS